MAELSVTVSQGNKWPWYAAPLFAPAFPFEVPSELSAKNYPPFRYVDYLSSGKLTLKAAAQVAIILSTVFIFNRITQ